VRLFVAVVACVVLTTGAHAGIYSPNEPFLFEIDAEGFAKPIQYSGGFNSILAEVREIGMRPQPGLDQVNERRKKVEARVGDRQARGTSTLPAEEIAGLTADLIRLNDNDKALNILQPLARDPRRGGFIAYTHLARAHAGRGEWREAFEQQQMAVRYSDFPTSFRNFTKPQLAWLKRVERDYYLPWLAHRADESRRGRPGDLREDIDVLFPTTQPPKRPEDPVQFVGPDGQYGAGQIAESERRKLPPDALAIVQQLVLWHPQDARLYWLLGELYNADGDVETAMNILDMCSYAMSYTNPNVIEHRRVLKSAIDTAIAVKNEQIARERELQLQVERDARKRIWWIVSIAVALGLLLIYYQSREVFRRIRRRMRA
jgi:tetratricopeptide (TPR) repeat protein